MGQTTFSGKVVSINGFTCGSFTTTQRNAISNPSIGLLIFNTTTDLLEVYNGTAWIEAFETAPAYPLFSFTQNATLTDSKFAISPAGTALVTITAGASNFGLASYTLGASFDVTSVTAGGTYSHPLVFSNTYSNTLSFNGDGTQIITLIDDAGVYPNSMTMSTPYDISTLSGTFVKGASSITAPSGTLRGLVYADGGTKAYVLASSGPASYVAQWNLSSAYDLASFSGAADATVTLSSLLSLPSNEVLGFTISADGLYAYITLKNLSNASLLYELSLGTAFDISTISSTILETYNLDTIAGFSGALSGGGIASNSTNTALLVTGPTNKIAQLNA